MCLSACIVETSMERSDLFKCCWIAMLIPKSAATASDQALTICLAQPQHQPQYGLLPMAPNLVYFPPGTMCWRTPRFRFVFKKKKNPVILLLQKSLPIFCCSEETWYSSNGNWSSLLSGPTLICSYFPASSSQPMFPPCDSFPHTEPCGFHRAFPLYRRF